MVYSPRMPSRIVGPSRGVVLPDGWSPCSATDGPTERRSSWFWSIKTGDRKAKSKSKNAVKANTGAPTKATDFDTPVIIVKRAKAAKVPANQETAKRDREIRGVRGTAGESAEGMGGRICQREQSRERRFPEGASFKADMVDGPPQLAVCLATVAVATIEETMGGSRRHSRTNTHT